MKTICFRIAAVLFPSAAAALLIACSRGLSSLDIIRHKVALSDGCFVVGLPEFGVGLLLIISQTGFFDIFAYAAHSLLVLFTLFRRPEDFQDYLTWRALRSRRSSVFGRMLLTSGIVFLSLSALLLS